MTFGVRGRHLVTGLPTEVQLHTEEVREALRQPLRAILLAIMQTLEETPPELASDIAKHASCSPAEAPCYAASPT